MRFAALNHYRHSGQNITENPLQRWYVVWTFIKAWESEAVPVANKLRELFIRYLICVRELELTYVCEIEQLVESEFA